MNTGHSDSEPSRDHPLRDVVSVMLKLGVIAFGGPAVHVAMLRDEVVRCRRWVKDEEFLDLFGAVSILPGPSSTQLAIVLSRRRAGVAIDLARSAVVDTFTAALAVAALAVLLRWRPNTVWLVLGGAAAGAARTLL